MSPVSPLLIHFESELFRCLGAQLNDAYFIVACSGGVDSVTLLHLAAQALDHERITVAHFDHNQRGRASSADARLVKNLAQKLKLKFKTAKFTAKRASENQLREARLAFLETVARGVGKKRVFILTAHHRGDQVETFFFRLLRGSGVRGLVGIRPVQGRLVRPLLGLSKKVLLLHATEQKWKWREDASNQETAFFRNRIRHQLLPKWYELTESFGGPAAWDERFSHLLEELEETEAAIGAVAQASLRSLFVTTPYWTRLTVANFCAQIEFWQRALLRNLFQEMGLPALTRAETMRLCAFLKKGKGKAELSNGCDAVVSQGYAFISVRGQALPQFSIPVSAGVEMRNLRVGDRYRGKPLADRLKKAKVPRPERALYPVLAPNHSSEIIWHPLSKKRSQFGANFKPSFDATWYRVSP